MNEAVFNLLMAVVTAAVTALSAFVAAFVKKKGEEAAAQTNSILLGNVIEEVTGIVSIAVSAVSQTYVDELKKAGSFDAEAQRPRYASRRRCLLLRHWKAPALRMLHRLPPALLLRPQPPLCRTQSRSLQRSNRKALPLTQR